MKLRMGVSMKSVGRMLRYVGEVGGVWDGVEVLWGKWEECGEGIGGEWGVSGCM